MAAAAIALVVASAAASAYASYQSGRAQKDAADYNSEVATRQAGQARDAAKIREQTYRSQVSKRMAQMRADYAASGVTMEGTPLMVMMESAREAEKDSLRIKYGGDIESSAYLSEAELQRGMGREAARAGRIGAGVSLLSGAARAATIASTSSSGTS